MNQLARRSTTDISVFDPAEARTAEAKLTAIIEYAKSVKDWPLLEQAVEQIVEKQIELVGWWDAKVRPPGQSNNADLGYLFVEELEKLTHFTQQQISKLRKKLKDVPAYRARLFGKTWAEAFGAANPHVANNSGENEWYTPADLIAAARAVLGGIDLDPASCALANETVQATNYFDAKQNGLVQKWSGRVWLNPPYAQPLISQFSAAVVSKRAEYDAACVLVNNATDTDWLQNMLDACDAACFLRGRVRFIDKEGDPSGAPLQGQVVLYLGPRTNSFGEVFAALGWVCRKHG